MPQEPGGDRAPGRPAGADRELPLGIRARAQALDLVQRDGEREIPDRPDVRAPERHQVIDVRAPRADAAQGQERLTPFDVRAARDVGKAQAAIQDRAREPVAIRGLLPREPEAVQARDSAAGDELRRHVAEMCANAPEEASRRDDRDLLLEHDVDERRESRVDAPTSAAGRS